MSIHLMRMLYIKEKKIENNLKFKKRKKKRKGKSTSVLRKDLVNPYQKTKKLSYVTLSGLNKHNKKCEFMVSEKQLYIEDSASVGDDQTIGDTILLDALYGCDILRKKVNHALAYAQNGYTQIILFDAFGLKTLNVPERVESLELYGCDLEEVTLPESLVELTIIKCSKLKSIEIPDSVEVLKLSKNGFSNNFNIPNESRELIVDINAMDDEVLNYLDNDYVNITLVSDNETLGT